MGGCQPGVQMTQILKKKTERRIQSRHDSESCCECMLYVKPTLYHDERYSTAGDADGPSRRKCGSVMRRRSDDANIDAGTTPSADSHPHSL